MNIHYNYSVNRNVPIFGLKIFELLLLMLMKK